MVSYPAYLAFEVVDMITLHAFTDGTLAVCEEWPCIMSCNACLRLKGLHQTLAPFVARGALLRAAVLY